jgi:hypothetical protein
VSNAQKTEQLADIVHASVCRWNHADECAYHYSDWKVPLEKNLPVRQRAFTAASKMLEVVSFEDAVKLMNIAREGR